MRLITDIPFILAFLYLFADALTDIATLPRDSESNNSHRHK